MPQYLFLHKLQHSAAPTAKCGGRYGYKQHALRSLMLRPWHCLHICCMCFKLMAVQGKPWTVLFPHCRQTAEKVSCVNIAGRWFQAPFTTIWSENEIQTKQVFKKQTVNSVLMSHMSITQGTLPPLDIIQEEQVGILLLVCNVNLLQSLDTRQTGTYLLIANVLIESDLFTGEKSLV